MIDLNQYTLALRFAVVNVVGFALLGAAYMHGLVHKALAADATYLTAVIGVVFLVGLTLAGTKAWQTSRELNKARAGVRDMRLSRDKDARRLRLFHRIVSVRNTAASLVLLGLIGTVLGFIIALGGVDPQSAGDVTRITPMVTTLVAGMSTALYTTLVGAILNIWLMANYRQLEYGVVKLLLQLER